MGPWPAAGEENVEKCSILSFPLFVEYFTSQT